MSYRFGYVNQTFVNASTSIEKFSESQVAMDSHMYAHHAIVTVHSALCITNQYIISKEQAVNYEG